MAVYFRHWIPKQFNIKPLIIERLYSLQLYRKPAGLRILSGRGWILVPEEPRHLGQEAGPVPA